MERYQSPTLRATLVARSEARIVHRKCLPTALVTLSLLALLLPLTSLGAGLPKSVELKPGELLSLPGVIHRTGWTGVLVRDLRPVPDGIWFLVDFKEQPSDAMADVHSAVPVQSCSPVRPLVLGSDAAAISLPAQESLYCWPDPKVPCGGCWVRLQLTIACTTPDGDMCEVYLPIGMGRCAFDGAYQYTNPHNECASVGCGSSYRGCCNDACGGECIE